VRVRSDRRSCAGKIAGKANDPGHPGVVSCEEAVVRRGSV
jgi:hypothetical protein